MTTRCGNCNHLNDEGAMFCANCHHFLAWSASPPTSPETGPQPSPPPAPPPPPLPPPPTPAVDLAETVPQLIAAIDESSALVDGDSRPDLSVRLERARARFDARTVTVAVVGEFKRGKSTLVNALIQTAACPVDADIVTAVPTLVTYGEQLKVTAHVLEPGRSETTPRPVAFDGLAGVVSEAADGSGSQVCSVEVEVPHRMLRAGLRLLDTPGVGGLESVHGQATLACLSGADGVLFVTDASQELTAPELEFLRSTMDRCPTVAMVVTKTDLHQHWRRIVELNRGHLRDAGLDHVRVIPVSSFLRLRAARQPTLNEESGFEALIEFLARDVVQRATVRAAATVAHDVDFVATQLAHAADAERVVLAQPEQGEVVVDRLSRATERARALSDPKASWQQVLDGIQDLTADVEYDLQARLRAVLRDVREIIDQSDPRDTWTDTEAWLRREVAAAGVANRDLLMQRALAVGDEVATQFNLEAGEAVELELDLITRALEEHDLPSASTFSMPGGRLGSLLVTARTTALVPMMAVGLTGFGIPLLLLAGAAILVGAGIGGKLIFDESKRQRSYRQGQAKAAAAKFIDEIAFEMKKETLDALRLTQRLLRDEFQARARTIQASALSALSAAQRASTLDPAAAAKRSADLDSHAARLGDIRSNMRVLSAAGAGRA